MKIGIIGNGFVGSAIAEGFKLYCDDLLVYDSQKERSVHSLKEVSNADLIFISVPTPMKDLNNREADLSILYSVFKDLNNYKCKGLLIIKSTVPVGTTATIQEKYKHLNICHSPEFLTARKAKIDFCTPSRNIVGYTKDKKVALKLKNLYKKRFPGTTCLLMSSDESEMVKYMANCFFATKVSFFNEMYLLAHKLGLNWESLLEGVLSDGRIGVSHYDVPGHDGDFGFGGTCFPKDINALINLMKSNNIKPYVLEGAWKQNIEVRKDKDWENNPSALSIEEINKHKNLIKEGWKKTDQGYFHPDYGNDLSGCGHDYI
tara:strand:+ start:2270 stop:3220 length:951 start_codon:yes stop_codon:yes gene_type:complete